jgi:release factor H-coupled RctB family protein
MIEIEKNRVLLFASEKNWVEGDALMQLKKTSELSGIKLSCGMPDIHPGKGGPVGASFLSEKVYPHLIGNDGGCGAGFFKTSLKSGKLKIEKWSKKLKDLENSPFYDLTNWLLERDLNSTHHDSALGTIGGGNHFAELQKTQEIFDSKAYNEAGLDSKYLMILVHSGSRSFGEELYRGHTGKHGTSFIEPGSDSEREYMGKHDQVLKWAKANRELIAERFMDCLGGRSESIVDSNHNSIERKEIEGQKYWLHRKGAVATDRGLVMVLGSRGTLSYLVKPTGNCEISAWSIAHGSGRKWNRGNCRGRLEKKWGVKDLERTDLGSVVICKNRELLYEEAPQAYKSIDVVITDMIDDGLIEPVASFKPVITYKTRKR